MISVTATVTAQNSFTPTIAPVHNFNSPKAGHLTISISGTFVANVIVQRSFNEGASWHTITTYTTAQQLSIIDKTEDVLYRIGVATGGFTSGSAVLRLAK